VLPFGAESLRTRFPTSDNVTLSPWSVTIPVGTGSVIPFFVILRPDARRGRIVRSILLAKLICSGVKACRSVSFNIVTRRLKVAFCDVHCYATTSQSARCIRCDRCYLTDTKQFLTIKRFLSNQIVATEDTTVRDVRYPVRKICLRG
jgi:hypothetical protein